MQSSELLQTIAGVAVALTGFSGVVVVLGPRAGGIIELAVTSEPVVPPGRRPPWRS